MKESNQHKKLGKKMISYLLEIAQLTKQPIKKMRLNDHGAFEEVKNMFSCVK